MAREISAGGVVVRLVDGSWHVALIEPRRSDSSATKVQRKRNRAVFALPKGLVDPGEKPEATAIREVREETGVIAEAASKLADIKYVYVRSWGDGERVFKIVSFYLLHYVSGEIDEIDPEMRIEVKRSLWVPITEAERQMAYSNERKVLRLAQEYLQSRESSPRKPAKS